MTNALVRNEKPQLASIDEPILHDAELWDIVSSGDLKALNPKQRSDYYLFRCRQEGLNPASQPFTYLVLNGKGVLYGNKTAADQLRKVHGITITKVECIDDGEYITYEVTVKGPDGRTDFEIGSVHVGAAKGPERANAKMKALTKAKRRATYSICGTGVLDETEVETIVGGRVYDDLKEAGFPELQADQQTGVITARQLDAMTAGAKDESDGHITRDQTRRITELKTGLNWHIAQMRAFSKDKVGKENANDLTADEAQYLIERLEEAQDADTQAGLLIPV